MIGYTQRQKCKQASNPHLQRSSGNLVMTIQMCTTCIIRLSQLHYVTVEIDSTDNICHKISIAMQYIQHFILSTEFDELALCGGCCVIPIQTRIRLTRTFGHAFVVMFSWPDSLWGSSRNLYLHYSGYPFLLLVLSQSAFWTEKKTGAMKLL